MSEIQRLLRVASRRNKAAEYGKIRIRLLQTQIDALRAMLKEDGVSANVLFEAVVRGYLMRDPAVLAMIDAWARDEKKQAKEAKSLSKGELDDIYAELGSGILDE